MTYTRISGSRNKINQRGRQPFTPKAGVEVTHDGKVYVRGPTGSRVGVVVKQGK